MSVRVRFAPSPTGQPHVGNMRSALFNWLFARHHQGVFVLRIEDTDVARRVEGAVEAIMHGLRWLGLDWDEGPEVGGPHAPYFQSQRLPLYHEHALRLLKEGKAYRCYCPPERLTQLRAEQRARGEPPGYDRHCRYLSANERAALEEEGIRSVVRFAMPETGTTTFIDLLRGEITFDNSTLEDFVMIKSDGYPTYHFANVVDDHLMEITHVLRAEEWIPSTPLHVQLYKAFGWDPPAFAHLPVILAPDRSKLSKRHGATYVGEYEALGYLPEAMVNYLALLGWSWDERTEIFSREELIEKFDLDRVNPSPAVFNIEKLNWMNGYYINHILSTEDLAQRCIPFMQRAGLLPATEDPHFSEQYAYFLKIVPLIKERMKFLREAPELTDFFFASSLQYRPEDLIGKGMDVPTSLQALKSAHQALASLPSWDRTSLETTLRGLAASLQLRTGPFFMTLRVAVTGRTVSPPLFETMEVLGRERTLTRMDAAARVLETLASG
jgi:glutamyl-tRNA synthetase